MPHDDFEDMQSQDVYDMLTGLHRDLVGAGLAETLLEAGTEVAQKAASAYDQSQADKASAAADAAAAQAAIRADVAATAACADVAVAQQSGTPQQIAAKKAAAEAASAAQDAAGRNLSSAAIKKRIAAAQDAVTGAVSAWNADPNSARKAAMLKCAQATLAKAQMSYPTADGDAPTDKTKRPREDEPSFFKRVRWGLPTYGWVGIGTVVVTGLGLGIRHALKRRR